MQSKYQRLYKKLGYTFQSQTLLKQALTHCSVGPINNERLEYLGDSILSFVIATTLFEKFPDQREGDLSRLRAYLVKGEMLATIALELEIGDYLHLGQGELKSGGFRRSSILADALEAICAAVFIDGGFTASKEVILNLYRSRIDDPNLTHNLKDPKTALQEYLQAQKLPLPNYTLAKVEGEEHDQLFHVICNVPNLEISTKGSGDNRRKAEQRAAREFLKKLQSK